jgi:hypothetical protein
VSVCRGVSLETGGGAVNDDRAEAWEPDGSELDFWIGEWDVRWAGDGHGTNSLSRILADRVILERFRGESPRGTLEGRSFSVYDPERRLWRQTWVDDQGSYLDFVGDRMDGNFVFRRHAPELGAAAEQRMVFPRRHARLAALDLGALGRRLAVVDGALGNRLSAAGVASAVAAGSATVESRLSRPRCWLTVMRPRTPRQSRTVSRLGPTSR